MKALVCVCAVCCSVAAVAGPKPFKPESNYSLLVRAYRIVEEPVAPHTPVWVWQSQVKDALRTGVGLDEAVRKYTSRKGSL